MSKAFAKETDAEENPSEEGLDPGLKLPEGARNYVTPEGYAKIKEELDFLLRTERPKLVEVVHWAASNGDRSENGDYIYGKRRLREIDRRIRFLTKRLDFAEVVDPSTQKNTEQVFFGARVTFCDLKGEDQGKEQTFQIVGIDEMDIARGRISWISPLAKALLKAREGDTARFQSPAGLREIEILNIEYS